MTQTPVVPLEKLFAQVLDPASRANPYPLYARLRQAPASVQDDGTYVVSTYREISLLLHDPRISSDERKSAHPAGALTGTAEATTPSLIFTDPPEHTQLRRLVMHQFTPQRIAGMQEQIEQVVNALLDARKQQKDTSQYQDFLQMLLDENIPTEDIVLDSLDLLIAGHETTANTMGFSLYLLSQVPNSLNLVSHQSTWTFKRKCGKSAMHF